MRKTLAAILTVGGLLLAAVPVWAHHAIAAEFDADKPVKFKGTVTKMEWINPHACTWPSSPLTRRRPRNDAEVGQGHALPTRVVLSQRGWVETTRRQATRSPAPLHQLQQADLLVDQNRSTVGKMLKLEAQASACGAQRHALPAHLCHRRSDTTGLHGLK